MTEPVAAAAAAARRRTLSGTFWGVLAEGTALPAGLVLAAFLTRRLGPEGYGTYGLAAALVFWIEACLNALLARATIALVSRAEDWRPAATTALRLALGLGASATALLALLALAVARVLDAPGLAPCLALFALHLPLGAVVDNHRQVLIGLGRYQAAAALRATRWGGRAALIVLGAALVEPPLIGAVAGVVATTGAELLLARRLIGPALFGGGRPALPVRALLRLATPLLVVDMGQRLLPMVDLLAVAALGGGAAAAGYYAAAQNLAVAPSLFGAAFAPLLLAGASRALADGQRAAADDLVRLALRLPLLLLPFAAMAAGAATEVAGLVYGPAFAPAGSALALLLFATVGLFAASISVSVLVVAGRPGAALGVTLPPLAAAAVGHPLLVPQLGPVGAALVTAGAAWLGASLGVGAVHRHWRRAPSAATALHAFLLVPPAYATAALVPTDGAGVVAKLVLVTFGVLFGFVLLGELDGHERAAVRAALGRPAALRRAAGS